MSLGLKEPDEQPRATGSDALRDQFYRSGLYRLWMDRKKNQPYPHLDCAPLIAGKTAQIQKDILSYAHQNFILDDTLWQRPAPYDDLNKWLHSFQWLVHLEDLSRAEKLVQNWIDHHDQWHFLKWDPVVLSHRIQNWVWLGNQIEAHRSPETFAPFHHSLFRQACHLIDRKLWGISGIDRLFVRYGQVFAIALVIPHRPDRFQKQLDLFKRECEKQILPDGAHVSRNPHDMLNVLEMLERLQRLCAAQKCDFPVDLSHLQERIYPLIKSLMGPNRTLGRFQGGHGGLAQQIKRVFANDLPECQPLMNARHAGYQRLEAGTTVLIMDCGVPAALDLNPKAIGSVFAFECWDADFPLITNCGSFIDGPDQWQDSLKSSSAASCLVIDNQDMFFSSDPSEQTIEVRRIEEKSNILIEATHNGYVRDFSLRHRRALFMDQTGRDIRVEDHLIGTGGNRFEIHLHLHPEITALKSEDEKTVLLQTNGAGCWALSGSPCDLSLEESVYFNPENHLFKSQQVILSGILRGNGALIKWRLNRLGDRVPHLKS